MIWRRSTAAWRWPVFASGCMVLLGLLIGYSPSIGSGAVVLALVSGLMLWRPRIGLYASLATIAIGQVIRIPLFGGEGSVIPNDIILLPTAAIWLLQRLASGRWPMPKLRIWWPMVALLLAMVASLFMNRDNFLGRELLASSLYIIRWIEYAAFLLLVLDEAQRPGGHRRLLSWIMSIGVLVALLGFVQLRVFPDFSSMVPNGWDPHIGRLLSTWYDPNFLSGFFAMLICVGLTVALSRSFMAARWWWLAIMLLSLATVFTFSRSGYVALVAGVGFVTLWRSRLLLVLGICMAAATVAFVPRVQERVIGIRSVDETAQLRIVSWQNAGQVIADHPWFGVGYNSYRFVQAEYGFVKDAREHSASGSDSSILTTWVTMGIIGLLAFVWLGWAMAADIWDAWRDRSRSWMGRSVALGVFAAGIALFVHSQFVNSFYYPHMLQAWWLLYAIAVTKQGSDHDTAA